MNPQEPVVPDPGGPREDTPGPVEDPSSPDQPSEYQAGDAPSNEGLDDYDQAVAESFPASDPPAASEPGTP
ncbi:MAG TPA: hypothetical protein VGC96_03290 [Candidatus Elarobacter sp.]|jgi:hypothetical protein